MPLIETTSTIVSLLGMGNALYDYVTGLNVTKQISNIERQINQQNIKLNKIDNKLHYLPMTEIISYENNLVLNDINKISLLTQNIRSISNNDIIVSSPILTPSKMKRRFIENPEKILLSISPINNLSLDSIRNLSDITLKPIIFSRRNQELIGFLKIGWFEDYFNCNVNDFRTHNLDSNTSLSVKDENYYIKEYLRLSESKSWESIILGRLKWGVNTKNKTIPQIYEEVFNGAFELDICISNSNDFKNLLPLVIFKNLNKLIINFDKDFIDFENKFVIPRESRNLKEVVLNNVKSLNIIQNVFSTKKLIIQNSNSKVHDLTRISNLIYLEELTLSNQNITSLSPLVNMKNLKILNISKNPIKDLKPLINCISLEVLNISDTQVDTLMDIINLPNLREVYSYRTRISSKEIKKITSGNIFNKPIKKDLDISS